MELENLVYAILSQDAEVQKAANDQFNSLIQQNPIEICTNLMEIFNTKTGENGKTFLVFLSRIVKNNLNEFLGSDFRVNIIEFSLSVIANPNITANLQLIAADLLSSLTQREIPDGLIDNLMTISLSENIGSVNSSITVLLGLFNSHIVPNDVRKQLLDSIFEKYHENPNFFIPLISTIFDTYPKMRDADFSPFAEYVIGSLEYISSNAAQFYNFLQLLDTFVSDSLNCQFFGESFNTLIEFVFNVFRATDKSRSVRILCVEILNKTISSELGTEFITTILESVFEVIISWDPETENLLDPEYEDQTPRTETEEILSQLVCNVKDMDGIEDFLLEKINQFSQVETVPAIRGALIIIRECFMFFSSPAKYSEFISFFTKILTEIDDQLLHKETYNCLMQLCSQKNFTSNFNSGIKDMFEWALENDPTLEMFQAFSRYINMSDTNYLTTDMISALVDLCSQCSDANLALSILHCISTLSSRLSDEIDDDLRDQIIQFVLNLISEFPIYAINTYLYLIRDHEFDTETLSQVAAALCEANIQDLSKDEYSAYSDSLRNLFTMEEAADVQESLLSKVYEIAEKELNIQECNMNEIHGEIEDNDIRTFHLKSKNSIIICNEEDVNQLNSAIITLQFAFNSDSFEFDTDNFIATANNVLKYQYIEDIMEPFCEILEFAIPCLVIAQTFNRLAEPLSLIDPILIDELPLQKLLEEIFQTVCDAAARTSSFELFLPIVQRFICGVGTRVFNNLDNDGNDEINYLRGKLMFYLMLNYADVFTPFFQEIESQQFPLAPDSSHIEVACGSLLPHFFIAPDPNEYLQLVLVLLDNDNQYLRAACIEAAFMSISQRDISGELILEAATKIASLQNILDVDDLDEEEDYEYTDYLERAITKHISFLIMKAFQIDNNIFENEELYHLFTINLSSSIPVSYEPIELFLEFLKTRQPTVDDVVIVVNVIESLNQRSQDQKAMEIKQRFLSEWINADPYKPIIDMIRRDRLKYDENQVLSNVQ